MKKKMVGDMPGKVLGMLADLMHKLQHGSLTLEEFELFLKRQNPFVKTTDIIAEWQVFYQETFGINPDFSSLNLPVKIDGFDRLIVVAQGITLQSVYESCANLFPCCKWTEEKEIDEVIDFSFQIRSAANGSYAIWVRDQVEANEELKNLSADILQERVITGITLEERLIYELKFFKETEGHLDLKNVTICVGSRGFDGGNPKVDWSFGKLNVGWNNADAVSNILRLRQVVS
jgi:hypothetical protein